jgi:ribosome-binding protein aMBF1 (putative translation factor)
MNKRATELERLLAENLRRERNGRDWSRKELAQKAKLQEAIIAKTESLISFPTAKNLEKLAKALQVEPYQLLMPKGDLDLLRAVKNLALKR